MVGRRLLGLVEARKLYAKARKINPAASKLDFKAYIKACKLDLEARKLDPKSYTDEEVAKHLQDEIKKVKKKFPGQEYQLPNIKVSTHEVDDRLQK